MQIYRGRVFTPVADPFAHGLERSYRYYERGYVAVKDGRIEAVGEFTDGLAGEVIDCGEDALITPGFVDTHLHAPQLEMIGSSARSAA